MSKKLRVGILGATGLVGQRLVLLLEDHPWFEVTDLAASDKSTGKSYAESCSWKLPYPMPVNIKPIPVKPVDPNLDCDFVFSSLPSIIAGEIECSFARAGYPVISNSSSYRMEPDVPLVIPEINCDHLDLIPFQQKNRNFDKGFIITNPNCTTIALALSLAPVVKSFGVNSVQVTSMQALSGAGQNGISSLDIIDNVLPYIANEEEKVETEPLKLFGNLRKDTVEYANFIISAQCNRVNVSDGHMLTVSVNLQTKAGEKQIESAFNSYISPIHYMKLPSAPEYPVVVTSEKDRPQPRLDRYISDGMACVVGRIRKCKVSDYKYVVLSHNTIRGAAGAAILNAELLKVKGFI